MTEKEMMTKRCETGCGRYVTWCEDKNICQACALKAERERVLGVVERVLKEWCKHGIYHEISDLNIPDIMADIKARLAEMQQAKGEK